MSIMQRMRWAVQGLRGGVPDNTIDRALMQASGQKMMVPLWRAGVPQWSIGDRARSYITDGFERNSVIYSAIMYKARAMTSAPLRGFTGDRAQPDPIPDGHPLAQLIRRPNPYQSQLEFQQLLVVTLNLAGHAFVLLNRERPGAVPSQMYILRPDRVSIVPAENRQGITGYLYTPDGQSQTDSAIPILPEDMMHTKLPNPGDSLAGLGRGMSPIKPAGQSGDVDNDVTEFMKLFFENGGAPQAVLKFNVPLNEDMIARIRARWHDLYGGYRNWSEVGVLDQGGDVSRLGLTFDEMGFDGIDERNEARILGPFGVPPILIGARVGLKHSTYANYETARRAFWEDTLDPELKLIEADYDMALAAPDGAFVRYDRSTVPALRKDVPALAKAAFDLWRMGVPALSALRAVGLSVEEFEGGDTSYVSMPGINTTTADAATAAPVKAVLEPDEIRPPRRRFKAYDRETMATKVDQLAVNHEEAFGDAAARMFDEDRREVLALAGEAQKSGRAVKGGFDWQRLKADIAAYYDGKGSENWREEFVPLLEGVMRDSGDEWAAALGVQWNVRNLRGEAWFEDYVLKFAQPISQTSSDTIHEILAQAQAEGWTISEMQDRLGQVFEQWKAGDLSPEDFAWLEARTPPYRREMIARTETIRAANAGAHNLFREWGVARKEWLATGDGRTRDSHVEAGRAYIEGGTIGSIPVDEPFVVGGYKMQYPGDASFGAPPSEFVNCRCADAPVIE